MKFIPTLLYLLVGCTLSSLHAETVKDREGAVRKDRKTMENDARWIFNDFQKGLDQAKATGKPLLVVLRCVPCKACMGMDAAVLSDKSIESLLDQFVCVRIINANALDLSLFQFDYDLSFSTLFFNGDGTVYARYGSWSHQKDPFSSTLTGYQRTLEAVLALHQAYPSNKPALAGKQGAPLPFRTAVEIPELAAKYSKDLDWNGKVVGSCVHCHMIGDAYRSWYRDAKKPIPTEWILPMPAPETIGLTLAPDQTARVQAVVDGSPAASAGLQPGDEILTMAGQSLVSPTDLSWALHRTPDQAVVPMVVRRNASEQSLNLSLPAGWRLKAESAGRVGTWPMRGMATGGMVLVDLSDDERQTRGLKPNQMALLVKSTGKYGKHAAAHKAGFLPDDIIVKIDGKEDRLTEAQLLVRLLQEKMSGKSVDVQVLRSGKNLEFKLPMQ
jgi:serine protease Do